MTNQITELKKYLIEKAKERYGIIAPAGNKLFDECFTEYNGFLLFWFNSEDKSTRVIKTKLK